MSPRYEIDFTKEAIHDLQSARAFDRRKIIAAIEQHLRFQPKGESKSRIKRMIQPFWSQFRLRSEGFRVYYDLDEEQGVVNILRILRKETDSTPGEPP